MKLRPRPILPGIADICFQQERLLSACEQFFRNGREVFSQQILDDITTMLREEYAIYFSTIQLETRCSNEGAAEIAFV